MSNISEKYEPYILIINDTLKCYSTYDRIINTLDSHFEIYFQNLEKERVIKKTTLTKEEINFIKEMVNGMYTYDKFNKAFLDGISNKNKAIFNSSDKPLIYLLLYLLIFNKQHIDTKEIGCFLLSQNPVKINFFFTYLFDESFWDEYIVDLWNDIYDLKYIEDTIKVKINEMYNKLYKFVNQISKLATGKEITIDKKENIVNVEKVKKTTKAVPFNLSKNKYKKLPQVVKIQKKVVSKPIPKNLFNKDYNQIVKEKEIKRQKNREETIKKNSNIKGFDFELNNKKAKTSKVIKKMIEEEENNIDFNKKYFKPVPDHLNDIKISDIKLTQGFIMKEAEAILRKKEIEEKKLRENEINLRDSSEFNNWKETQEKLENEQNELNIKKKKLEMEIAYEEAIKAKENKEKEKKENANVMKKEKIKMNKKKDILIKEDFDRKIKLKSTIEENKGLIKENQEKILKEKIIQNKKQIEDYNEKYNLKLIEEKEQQKLRNELISKIKELDRKVKVKPKVYDENYKTNIGILEEMSLKELRLKLVEVEEDEKIRLKEKNKDINYKKKDKLNKIQELKKLIDQERNNRKDVLNTKNKIKKLETKKELQRKKEISEKKLIECYNKIEKKKEKIKIEEKERKEKERELKLKKQYLQAGKDKVEEKVNENWELGKERDIKNKQKDNLIKQKNICSIKQKERLNQDKVRKNEFFSEINKNKDLDEMFEEIEKENEMLNNKFKKGIKYMHDNVYNYKLEHTKNLKETKPYNYK